MPRVKNPLPESTDREVLRMVARLVEQNTSDWHPADVRRFRRALVARTRAIARRVPLWTDRKEISR
jgi:hypothetical protein